MLVSCVYVGNAYGVCFAGGEICRGVECMECVVRVWSVRVLIYVDVLSVWASVECGVCYAGVECMCWYHVCMLVSYVYVLRRCVWCEV